MTYVIPLTSLRALVTDFAIYIAGFKFNDIVYRDDFRNLNFFYLY